MYVGETGRNVRTRKQEHVDTVKIFNTKKSVLSQSHMRTGVALRKFFDKSKDSFTKCN